MLYLELIVVVLLVALNGVLAMSELALVSARRVRLGRMAAEGRAGARAALRLIEDPGRFLATVQIGITAVGILAGAFSGATLADRLGDWLDTFSGVAPNGDPIAIGLVVVVITYLSLVVGELVPKRIALADPERVATLVARPMEWLARAAGPAVWLLRLSIDAVLALLRFEARRGTAVTEDEVRAMIAEGTRAGIFMASERAMIDGVLRLADRPVRVIMTPRGEIDWVDARADAATIERIVGASPHARLLVCAGSVDHAVGVVHTKDLLAPALRGEPLALEAAMRPPLAVPDRLSVLELIDLFRRERVHVAVVVDEYGVTEGLATVTDVLEAIAGDLPVPGEEAEPPLVRLDDGSWLADGTLPLDELEDRTGLRGLGTGGDVHTVAGLVLERLGRLPAAGESVTWRGARFEVVDMDERRIDKVRVRVDGGSAEGG